MVFSAIPQVITEDRASGAQFIGGSLKFDSSKSQYLKRTPTANGNTKLWTWSGWLKRTPGALHDIFSAGQEVTNDGLYSRFRIDQDDYLNYRQWVTTSSLDAYLVSGMKLRDPSAYFHYVAIYDSNNSTNSDKVRFYINGQRVTVFSSNDYPGGTNSSWVNNSTKTHTIGGHYDGGSSADSFFDGHMSQVYFIDGQALGPENFGYTDPLTGTWRPKKAKITGPNDGQVWSSNVTLNSGIRGGGSGDAAMFDGILPSSYSVGGNFGGIAVSPSETSSSMTIDLGQTFTNVNVTIYPYFAASAATCKVDFGGGDIVTLTGSELYFGAYDLGTHTFSSMTLTQVFVTGGGSNFGIGGIAIDGVMLINSTTNNFGPNGFYLPLDGNTPIGKDQSGRGNDWTPVNFGGSVELPKATGAIPILNTNDSGTVAKPGVRTDKKTYTVTASGGNYYLDGALKPTLNAYRGGSYIFDYTGATSHPFYLSSLPDGKHNSKAYSVEFDGSDDRLDFDLATGGFGSGDFTLEYFFYQDTLTNYQTHFGVTRGTTGFNVGTQAAGNLVWYDNNGGGSVKIDTGAGGVVTGRWYHVAFVRSGSTITAYLDGVSFATYTSSVDYSATDCSIGSIENGGEYTNGKISNFRINVGTAIYTSNFTPPQTTLSNVTNTVLLCCQDNDATTAVVKPGNITANGGAAATQTHQPFLYNSVHGNFGVNTATSNTTKITIPHLAADTLYYYCNAHSGMGSSINVTTDIRKADPYAWKCVLAIPGGGSISGEVSPQLNVTSSDKTFTQTGTVTSSKISNFYGASTDYAANPDVGNSTVTVYSTSSQSSDFAWGAGDFTWEWWMYHHDWDNGGGNLDQVLIYQYDGGNTSNMIETYIPGHNFSIYQQKAPVNGYISFEGNNTIFTLQNNQWVHCALVREGGYYKFFRDGVYLGKSASNTTSWGDSIIVLGRNEGNDLNGFDGLFQDIRMYGTAKYTASTVGEQAFTVPSIVPNILPDTPSGITGKTNLAKITDGAVALSRSPESHLVLQTSNDLAPESGDFTIETFIYANSFDNYPVMWDTRVTGYADTNGFFLGINNTGRLYMYDNGNTRIFYDTLILKKWHHIALVRKNNDFKMYVDGIQRGSTYSRNHNFPNQLRFIGDSTSAEVQVWQFNGFFSNYRFTKGQALYDGNFDVPTEPLTTTSQGATGSNVKLLACQSKTSAQAAAVAPSNSISALFNFDFTDTSFSDVSGNNIGITNTNSVARVTAPSNSFGITHAAEFTAGSSQKLVTASVNQNSSGAFSFDGFFYLKNVSETGYLFDARSSTYTSSYYIYYTTDSASGTATFYTPQGSFVKQVGQWFHIRATSSGVWYNSEYQMAGPGNQQFADMTIGSRYTSSTYLSGYVGAFRFFRNQDLESSSPSQYVLTSGVASNIVIKSITTSGSPSATNFNPFTDDINTIRGQESGYCTWNPLRNGATISNGNLDISTSDNARNTFATMGVSSGKWFWEVTINSLANTHYPGIGVNTDLSQPINLQSGGNGDPDGYMILASGLKFNNDVSSNYGAASSVGDVIGVALDMDAGTISFYHNGKDQGVAFSGITGTAVPVVISWTGSTCTANFGQKPFKFPPPDGFQPLNFSNVQPEKVIARPDQYVKANIWSGDNNTRDFDIGMKPDLVWIKCRSDAAGHRVFDSVRGPRNSLRTSSTDGQDTVSNFGYVSSFNNNGFTLTPGGYAGYESGDVNMTGRTYVGWTWKAGGSSGTFNVDGEGYATTAAAGITEGNIALAGASVGRESGFSIVTFTGNSTTTGSIGHGLNKKPQFVIVKDLVNGDDYQTKVIDSNLYLKLNNMAQTGSTSYSNFTATDSVINLGYTWNNDSSLHVAYSWHDVPGLQKFGTFVGNGTPGTFIELGFRPAIVLMKNTARTDSAWLIHDNARYPQNPSLYTMEPNTTDTESSSPTSREIDMLSNGFRTRGTSVAINESGSTIFYAAWAEAPTVNLYGSQANAR